VAGSVMAHALRDGLARLRSLGGARAAVLLYHRVRAAETDPYMLDVTPDHFAEHLDVIRTVGRPMKLSELAAHLHAGTVPAGALCVTFDDAYADTLRLAKPLLERYGVPATVFVTTGPQGRIHEFWWDELERIFLRPGRLPEALRLPIDGTVLEGDLGPDAEYTPDLFERHTSWTVSVRGKRMKQGPTARHTALRVIYDAVLELDEQGRDAVLQRLRDWAGTPEQPRPPCRALDPEGVRSLEHDAPVEVGVHTRSHVSLPAQRPEIRRSEVRESKAALEDWVGHPVTGFSYPHGHVCADSAAAVAEAGLTHACTTVPRAVRRGDEALALPRTAVLDCDGEELERILRRQLGRAPAKGRR
jgi:peptidoglycan/xylan/chitin deacetylase (PgdA/CDA1 family)